MKKALFISSRPIYPIICGGQIRTEQQLEFLSREFDVDVLFISDSRTPEIEPYYKFCKKVKFFYRSKLKCILSTSLFLFNNLPLQVNYYRDNNMINYVKSVAKEYDLIFCNNIRTAEYARGLNQPKCLTIMDFVDCISMNYEKARNHSLGIKKVIYNIDFHRCRKYEKKILKEFDSYSLISSVDKQYMLS